MTIDIGSGSRQELMADMTLRCWGLATCLLSVVNTCQGMWVHFCHVSIYKFWQQSLHLSMNSVQEVGSYSFQHFSTPVCYPNYERSPCSVVDVIAWMWNVLHWLLDLDTWFPAAGDVWEVCGNFGRWILAWEWVTEALAFFSLAPVSIYSVLPDGWCRVIRWLVPYCHVIPIMMTRSPRTLSQNEVFLLWVDSAEYFCLSNKRGNE